MVFTYVIKLLQQICDSDFMTFWLLYIKCHTLTPDSVLFVNMLPSLYLILSHLSSFPFCAILFIFFSPISCIFFFFCSISSFCGDSPLPFIPESLLVSVQAPAHRSASLTPFSSPAPLSNKRYIVRSTVDFFPN